MAHRHWTDDEIAILRARYPHEPTTTLAQFFGRKCKSVFAKANLLGMMKTPDFMASPLSDRIHKGENRGNKFAKGSTAWNKGMKGLMLGPAWAKFQPGNTYGDVRPIGAISRQGGYKTIKVQEADVWEYLHRHLWKEAGREIPAGMCVSFKDGNKENVVLENLQLKSKQEILDGNHVKHLPQEPRKVIFAMSLLNRKLNSVK